jgi:Na+-transporting methylmalonyl-CoA/oxaloacetate decarboxylase gamma subunit
MKRFLYILPLLFFPFLSLCAQNVIDLRITEIMVDNESSVVDDYGRHSSWVEVMNISQGTVNYGGCYFSDDLNDLTKSQIPGSDKATSLKPRQVTLFYATGRGDDGTFYLNFTLKPGSTLYLVSNDGHTVIDSIEVPSDLPAGQSLSKFANDSKQIVFDDIRPSEPTPGVVNGKTEEKPKAMVLAETDPHGVTLTIVSVSVVFCALIILFIIYNFSGKCFSGQVKFPKLRKKAGKKAAREGECSGEVAAAIAMALQAEQNSDVEAAIALALHMYLGGGVHDSESFVITIRPQCGGWNDKSLGFRKSPIKK